MSTCPRARLRCQRAEVEDDPDLDRTGIADSVPGARRDEQRGPGGQLPWLAVEIRRRVPVGNVKELLGIWMVVLGERVPRAATGGTPEKPDTEPAFRGLRRVRISPPRRRSGLISLD